MAAKSKPAAKAKPAAKQAPAKPRPAAKPAAKPVAKAKAPVAAKIPAKPAAKAAPAKPVAKPAAVVQTPSKADRRQEGTMKLASPFTKDELKQWKSELLEHRAQISGDINDLEHEAMEQEDGHATPTHMAERGSDAEMQDVSLGIAGDEKETIWQIDRAIAKIDTGVPVPFGLCEYTKQPIQRQRLQHIPWTPLSIEGATHMENNGLTLEDLLVEV